MTKNRDISQILDQNALYAAAINATAFTTTGFRANTTVVVPTSNSSGQTFGNTLSGWVITANSVTLSGDASAAQLTTTNFAANSSGVFHTATINAAAFTTTGFRANTTFVVPTSNSSGQGFGNTISRWDITANSVTVSSDVSPDSNTVGQALGSTTQRWNLNANTINASGTVTLSSALNLTSGQITFPASQNATTAANVLDDYEEGTFTPTFIATGCTFSYASQSGWYIKVGGLVHYQLIASLNTSGNTLTANPLSVGGLPFATYNTGIETPGASVFWWISATSYIEVSYLLGSGATSGQVKGNTAALTNNISQLAANAFLSPTAGTIFWVSGTYIVQIT